MVVQALGLALVEQEARREIVHRHGLLVGVAEDQHHRNQWPGNLRSALEQLLVADQLGGVHRAVHTRG